MAAFTAAAFLAKAKLRYNAAVLENRMRGVGGVAVDADKQLTEIAAGVMNRVQAACLPSVGWPLPGVWPADSVDPSTTLPGTNISGVPYADIWPQNLLQMAMDLFNWRTISGLDGTSDSQRAVGKMAEKYFTDLESGTIALGIGGDTDVSSPSPLTARNRDGSSNVDDVPDQENSLALFQLDSWTRG